MLIGALLVVQFTASASDDAAHRRGAPFLGVSIDRTLFPNPYAHIPAQCYIETSAGTQNACQFCHTDGPYKARLGNNNPQGGADPLIGNLQAEYAFVALNYPHSPNGSINHWRNTLYPERLRAAVKTLGESPDQWDMRAYIRQDNWRPAFAKRPGSPRAWDCAVQHALRLFPGLDPADLPADDDGYVRSASQGNGRFHDAHGWNTGWRSVNFVPYAIFTPLTGSVSGIYLRLQERFMRNADQAFDLDTYSKNLALLARAIQDRLRPEDPKHFFGAASDTLVERGLYPLGTEFAHPLHYVDTAADGRPGAPSPFPGTRAKRVKEVRWMYKIRPFEPHYASAATKEEDAPVHASERQGWIDNGAGWLLAGFIEERNGHLRPQTPSELAQCVGCHSGNGPQQEIAHAEFTSGTGNTIDSTWALARQLPGKLGWREMDYLGYRHVPGATGRAAHGEPLNRGERKGEFRYFLDHVVGINLYGVMPAGVERYIAGRIRQQRGYAADWPALDLSSAPAFIASQRLRQTLLRSMTQRAEHLDQHGHIAGPLLYPTSGEAIAAARRYRQVVVTQSYDFGKDVFPNTPVTLRYFRSAENAYTHQNGRPYALGEIIFDRPLNNDPVSITYGVGTASTLIDETLPFARGGSANSDYLPLLSFPEDY